MIHPTIAGDCFWCAKVAVNFLAWSAMHGSAASELKDMVTTYEPPDPGQIIGYAWATFTIVWLVAAFWRKRVQKRQPVAERLIHVVWMTAAAVLLIWDQTWYMGLNARFLPTRLWIEELGAWVTVAGAAFAIWARLHLGRNWSGTVTIKEDHSLIRTGPYKYIRHPIYTGLLLGLAGSALAIGEYRAILGFTMFLVGLVRKAKREESFLAEEFGPAFEEHKKKTGFLLPRFS